MQRRTLLLSSLGLGAAAVTAMATGCTPGGGGSAGKGQAEPAQPASTELATDRVALTMMATPESGAAASAAIAGFGAKHSNISIDYSQTNFEDYNQSVNLNLSGGQSPDIVLLNMVANTVKNKLVLPLDEYAKLYGWTEHYPSTQLDQWRVAENGLTLGSGALYAAPAGFSLVGLYYNKKLAKELGIEAPRNLAEFEAALTAAKSRGILPIQVGNAVGHSSYIVQLLAQDASGVDAASAWSFGSPGSSFATPANTAAVERLRTWTAAGHLGDPTAVNGANLQASVDNFVSGKGLFLIDGNWDAKKISDGLGADAGFVAFPGAKKTAVGTSAAFAISAQSKHPNEAAAFLEHLRSPEASALQFEQGYMPDEPSAAKAQPGTLQADIVDAWTQITQTNGLVPFFNNATATMNDTLTSGTQQIIAGKMDTKTFIDSVQADWDGTHGAR